MPWVLSTFFSFLLGSIPWGLWIGRWVRGIDVRQQGSGNLGATNVTRALGPAWGALVLLLDAGKGVGAVLLARDLTGSPTWGGLLGMAGAVLGHSFSPMAGFRGGKGVASAAGAWGALTPLPLALALGVWTILFALTRIVSLGSIVAALVLPVGVAFFSRHAGGWRQDPIFYCSVLLAFLLTLRHWSNLVRLLHGREKPLELRAKREA